jgi:hypothetical protein
MKERFVELGKKLVSIKILIGLPLATLLLCFGKIDQLVWVGAFFAILGLREVAKYINK